MIPPLAHFIWFGPAFPWLHRLAIESALKNGGFEQVVLHHDQDLSGQPHFQGLVQHPRFEARRMEVARVCAPLAQGAALHRLLDSLSSPSARANLVRAALLCEHGGVYLDMDTVTLAPLDALRAQADVFCGEEHVAFPATTMRSLHPGRWAKAWALTALRDGVRRLPDGWQYFRKLQALYPTAVNNAVLAARPGHPFVEGLLEAMLALPARRQKRRYALGTHLLQQQVAAYGGDDLQVHPPEVFYPLGPELSQHWFRRCRSPRLDEVLSPQTRVVHWYASVRTRRFVDRIDPAYVQDHQTSQRLSALALRALA